MRNGICTKPPIHQQHAHAMPDSQSDSHATSAESARASLVTAPTLSSHLAPKGLVLDLVAGIPGTPQPCKETAPPSSNMSARNPRRTLHATPPKPLLRALIGGNAPMNQHNSSHRSITTPHQPRRLLSALCPGNPTPHACAARTGRPLSPHAAPPHGPPPPPATCRAWSMEGRHQDLDQAWLV